MKEMFTKKNIITLSIVAVGILAVAGLGSLALRQIEVNSIQQVIRQNQELGANSQDLSKNFLEAMKEKDKEKLKALYCPEFTHRFGEKAGEEFSTIWDKAQSQDYSNATLNMDFIDESNGYRITIENVKKNQEIVKDYYATSPKHTFEDKEYRCITPIYPEG